MVELFTGYNFLDALIAAILIFYAVEGYGLGGVLAVFELFKFVISFGIGLHFYGVGGSLLIALFHLPKGIANAIGFFLIAFLAEIIFQFLSRYVVKWVYQLELLKEPKFEKMNKIVGIIPGLASGAVLVMFLLTVITALPVSTFLKQTIATSKMGSVLVARSQSFEKNISDVFGGAATETLNFLTVEPQSNSLVQLGFTYSQGKADPVAENEMLIDVNTERTSRGFGPLVTDNKLQTLARDHGQDMLTGGYFSHYTPEGLSPFDRMAQRDITYQFAGENLAFSPNVQLAMQGLMQSPGHRENILSPNFKRVGIGVIDAGIYGQMFVQEFTD